MQATTSSEINKQFLQKLLVNFLFWSSITAVYLLVSVYPMLLNLTSESVGIPALPIKYFDSTFIFSALVAFILIYGLLNSLESFLKFVAQIFPRKNPSKSGISNKDAGNAAFHDEIVGVCMNAGSILGSTFVGAWTSSLVNGTAQNLYAKYFKPELVFYATFAYAFGFFWNWASKKNSNTP